MTAQCVVRRRFTNAISLSKSGCLTRVKLANLTVNFGKLTDSFTNEYSGKGEAHYRRGGDEAHQVELRVNGVWIGAVVTAIKICLC